MNAISPVEARDRAPTGSELLTAVEAWRPDPECLRAGDEYVGLALRCYSGGLSNLQMRRRIERFAAELADDPPDMGPRDAAFAFAEHCAIVAVSPQRAVQILAHLSVVIPGWEPTDPDDIAALVRAIYRDISSLMSAAPDLEAIAREAQRKARDKASHKHNGATRGELHGRLRVFSVEDIDTVEPRDYLLKGLLSPGEVSIWVGPPKCGKSFLLLYLAYMLSLGRPVFGRRVKSTKVLYVAAEGEAGIANRIRALTLRHGLSADFHFIAQPADLLHADGHKTDLIEAAKACGARLIVLDTLSRLLAGGDENSPQDMGTFVRNVAEVRHETGAHVAIVHHGTKASNGSNPRGHSSLTGADDALIEIMRLADGSWQAIVIHAKDDPDGIRWGFKLESVELGTDDDDDPITTLLTTEMIEPSPLQQGGLSASKQIGMNALHAAMKARPIIANVGEDGSERAAAKESDWRDWFYRMKTSGSQEAEAKQKAFRRVADELLAKELIGSLDGFVWPKP